MKRVLKKIRNIILRYSSKLIDFIFPQNSSRRKLIKKFLIKMHLKSPYIAGYYDTWTQQQRRFPILINQSRALLKKPLISIVVPAYNTPTAYLKDLIYSINSQSYQNWELILVNASSNLKSKLEIDECCNIDKRIKVISVKNSGISTNTNLGIKEATGDYIAFCDHDDILEPFALYEVVLKIIDEDSELIYTDEDKISDDGKVYFDPFFKPDWSPDLLTHVNYINHLTVVKKDLLNKVGLLNPEMDGAQDYDLLLRIVDENPKIAHISKVIYHWRAARNSTAQDFSSKKNVTNAGKRAIEQHFERLNQIVKVTPKKNKPGFYSLAFKKVDKVSLLIMPFASDSIMKLFIELLFIKTDYSSVDIELIIPDGIEPRVDFDKVKVVKIDREGDYLKKATDKASSKKIVIVNRVAFPENKNWIQGLCGNLDQRHIKTVSPLIMQDDDIIDDCGLVKDSMGNYQTLFRGMDCSGLTNTFIGDANWVRDIDATNGSIVAINKKQFSLFLENYDLGINKAIYNFSKTKDLYNVIYTDVIFNSFNINISTKQLDSAYLNNNLIVNGDGFRIYTQESSVMNILLDIAQKEKLSI